MRMQLVGNRYRIKGLIGEGGMAAVYSAIDEKLDRRVAIKILHNHLARNDDIRKRFYQEARSVSGIDHPNIIKVYDFSGDNSEQLWIVTEILYGVDLSEYIEQYPQRKLNPLVGTLITREVCKALNEAHKNGIIHRDIKPENVMVLDTGRVKLMDFGIAKLTESSSATQTGTFMGSPSYMSPEQIRGIHVDGRTDIYSLCVLYYEILCGQLPYLGKTTPDVINKIMNANYKPPRMINPSVPEEINQFIIKGMQSDRNRRFSTIHELEISIDAYLHSLGFNESHVELERFFKNATEFEKRITRATKAKPIKAPAKTTKIIKKSHRSATVIQQPQKKRPRKTTTFHSKTTQIDQTKRTAIKKPTVYENKEPRQTSIQYNNKHRTKIDYSANVENISKPQRHKRPKKAVGVTRNISINQNKTLTPIWLFIAMLVLAFFGFQYFFSSKPKPDHVSKYIAIGSQPGGSNSKENTSPETKARPVPMQPTEKIIAKKPSFVRDRRNENLRTNISDSKSNKSDRINSPRQPNRINNRLAVAPKPINTPPTIPQQKSSERSDQGANAGNNQKADEKASITIRSFPPAQLYLNNRLIGSTRERSISQSGLKLGPGSYRITLKRPGYEDAEETIQINSNQPRNLRYALSKKLSNVKLILRSNRIPALVYIEQVNPTRSKRQITLNDRVDSIELPEGTYNVEMIYNGKSIERNLILNENIGDVTFNGSFD